MIFLDAKYHPYDTGREHFRCQKEYRGLYLEECKAGGTGNDLPGRGGHL